MTDTLVFGQQPTASPITPAELDQLIETRPTPLGEYFDAMASDAFEHSLPGAMLAEIQLPDDDLTGRRDPEAVAAFVAKNRRYPMAYDEIMSVMERTDVPAMSEQDWKASEWHREGISFDGRMTEARAKAKAEVFDEDQYRAWQRQNRPWGVATVGAAVLGSIIGSAPDPTNYIPVFSQAFRAANATRIGAIMARAGLGAADAAIMTAATEPIIASSRRQFGEDISFADQVMDIALGALVGGIGGGIHGRFERLPESLADRHPENVTNALQALGEAADALANDRPMDVGAAVLRAQTTRERLASTTTLTPVVSAFERHADLAPEPAAWRSVGLDDFRVRNDQSIDLGVIAPADAQRLNVPAGPIRLTKGWDEPAGRTGSGLVHISERHRDQILGFKDASGKPVYASVDEFVNDVVSTYTHIGHADAGRLLVAKMIPGLKERIAVVELDPRQHLTDIEATQLGKTGDLPQGDFYTVRTGGLRNPGWTMRRGREVLPRETPEPVVSRGPSAPGARGSEGNIGIPTPGRNIAIRDFEALPVNDSVAPEMPKSAPEALAKADVAIGKPQKFTDAGVKEQAADHGINPESGEFDELADLKRLQASGQLTKAEADALKEADATVKRTDDYAKAFQAAASCMTRK
jgi:hypothetical protein